MIISFRGFLYKTYFYIFRDNYIQNKFLLYRYYREFKRGLNKYIIISKSLYRDIRRVLRRFRYNIVGVISIIRVKRKRIDKLIIQNRKIKSKTITINNKIIILIVNF